MLHTPARLAATAVLSVSALVGFTAVATAGIATSDTPVAAQRADDPCADQQRALNQANEDLDAARAHRIDTRDALDRANRGVDKARQRVEDAETEEQEAKAREQLDRAKQKQARAKGAHRAAGERVADRRADVERAQQDLDDCRDSSSPSATTSTATGSPTKSPTSTATGTPTKSPTSTATSTATTTASPSGTATSDPVTDFLCTVGILDCTSPSPTATASGSATGSPTASTSPSTSPTKSPTSSTSTSTSPSASASPTDAVCIDPLGLICF